MQLEIPDDIVRRAEINAEDLRVALAVQLYVENRIDHADACRLADVPVGQFNRELLSRALTVQQYPAASLVKVRRTAG
jgi:predicted HTH domain antitoxin